MLLPVVWNRRNIPIHVSKTLVFHSCCKVWGHTVTVFSAADVLSFCRARDLASTIHTGSIAWHLYKSDQKKNGVYWRWEQRSLPGPCHYSIVVHIFFPSSKNEHDLRKMLVVCIIPFRRSARKTALNHLWGTEEVLVAEPAPGNSGKLCDVKALNPQILKTHQLFIGVICSYTWQAWPKDLFRECHCSEISV